MEFAKILEAMMLVIFGASWPAQILKTVRVKNPQGKSFLFLYMILTGYACGLASKFVGGNWRGNWIIYLYMLYAGSSDGRHRYRAVPLLHIQTQTRHRTEIKRSAVKKTAPVAGRGFFICTVAEKSQFHGFIGRG